MHPTDGNVYYLRQREAEEEAHTALFIECPDCNGTGEVSVQLDGAPGDPEALYDDEPCTRCHGTGEIEAEEEE